MSDLTRYRFGPLERRGLIAGWRAGQIASVAGGLTVAVVALHARPGASGLAVAVPVVLASVTLACWPVAGRTGEEWLPVVVRWTVDGVAGRRWCWPGPGEGRCLGPDGLGSGGPAPDGSGPGSARRPVRPRKAGRRPPSVFAGLDVLGVSEGHGPGRTGGRDDDVDPHRGSADGGVGVVCDRRSRTYTAVLGLRGHTFALLGPEDKERRVSGWSAVLASLAREGSTVHRLQWVASALPDDGQAVRGHLEDRGALPVDAPARGSYVRLLGQAGAHTCRHEVLLAVQVMAGGRTARAVRAGGGGDAGACAVLLREVATLRRLLAEADVTVEAVLAPGAMAGVLRQAVDHRPAARRSLAAGCPPCPVGWPWPMAVQAEWGRLRTDATWHATYWVAEWPRLEVGPDFLAPLLLGSGRRSLSVIMEPLSPLAATRSVEKARTADLADSELRRRGGFLSTARRNRESELVVRREEELADGHAAVRYSGYVTVTAGTPEELEDGCEAAEQAAGQARLELRRLYGDQERAFTCTLPLGRGLS